MSEPIIPDLILTRPSIAEQGEPGSPQQLYDPALASPFNSPSLGRNRDGYFGQSSPTLPNGFNPLQTPPARKSRARRYPSQDGYTSPQLGQEGFTSSRSRSGSPASPGGSPNPNVAGSTYRERMGNPGGDSPVMISLDSPPIDPLNTTPIATAGTPTTMYRGGVVPGARQDVWHRHARNFSNSSPQRQQRDTSSPIYNSPTDHRALPDYDKQNDDDDEDDDHGHGKRRKKNSALINVLAPLTWILPTGLRRVFTGSTTGNKTVDVLNADTRRKSTGTASATVRAKKQRERARRGEAGWVNGKNVGRLVLLVAILWMTNRWMDNNNNSDDKADRTTSTKKSTRKVHHQDLFHPKVGIYRNLPRHVVDVSPYHQVADGLLRVNTSVPVDRHPVYQLIKQARDEWESKKQRQSQTLKQAVEEYKRRNNGLMPPKGFDKWWEFVVLNEVQLPDEYDQINKDLYLYRALSPGELNRRLDRASEAKDTFTISIKHHNVRTRSTYDGAAIDGADDRLEAQIELLMDYGMETWLEDMRVVYGIHDGPTGFIGYDHRSDLETFVQDGEYYRTVEELDTTVRGWEAACPYGSPARSVTPTNRASWGYKLGKTFVQDPTVSQFDICHHPEYIDLHGALNGRRPHVQQTLSPMFSLSKTALHTDILGVPMEQWTEDLPTIEWERRTKDKLLWRGSNTGAFYSEEIDWRRTHRVRLVELARGGDEMVDVIPPPRWGKADDDQEREDDEDDDDDLMAHKRRKTIKQAMRVLTKDAIERKMLDIAFAGEPIQCEMEDGTCEQLSEEYIWAQQKMTHEEALEYKYVVDVDGNTWSSRFQRLLLGGSVVFKSTIMPEWWNQRAQPWVHYVPVGLNYGDLVDALVFFRGGVDGKGGEDELARQIANAGAEWTMTHWRKVDMAAYIGRVYLEWARLVAPVRSSMDFVYDESMEVELVFD